MIYISTFSVKFAFGPAKLLSYDDEGLRKKNED